MLQRPIVKAKKCVPAARRTVSEGIARGTAFHRGCILTEQTLPALAIAKTEVALWGQMTLGMPLESAIHVLVLSHGDIDQRQQAVKIGGDCPLSMCH